MEVDGDVAALRAHESRRARGVAQQRGVLGERVAGPVAALLAALRLALAPRRGARAAGPGSATVRFSLHLHRTARAYLCNHEHAANLHLPRFCYIFRKF